MTVVPEFAGCPWPIDTSCLGDTWDTYDAPTQERAQTLAGETLRRLTGYRVGGCPVTVRPCAPRCLGGSLVSMHTALPYYSFGPLNIAGNWVNACGCAMGPCGCTSTRSVALITPVGRVDEVRVDGLVLDPSEYMLLDGHLLTRLGESWPVEQDMGLPDTEPGTWSVTYLNAYEVDGLGAYAGGILAGEYAKACSGGKCRLPATVTNVTRQGVTYEIPAGAFPGGLTGIREVDAYVALWNPNHLTQPSTVWGPSRRLRTQ